MNFRVSLIFACLLSASFPGARVALADAGSAADEESSAAGSRLEEVVVTARKRAENLQRVPDAITAFTAKSLAAAGIDHIADFAALTPNLTFQDGRAFRAGFFNLSMRGIGNGQEGWPSVAYLVDGVPADSTDSINSGSLQDLERIEVLRGPQSALYGAGAIAGAINIVSKRPTNESEEKIRAAYGSGDNREIGAMASGAIVPGKVLFRVDASHRDDDGLIQSASNGLDLAFVKQTQVQGRLILTPRNDLEIDLHGRFDKERNGSTYQDKLASADDIDNFSPALNARRALPGYDDRSLYSLAARVQWDLPSVSVISVTGFSHIDQHLSVSVCYDDPDAPLFPLPGGGVECLFGPGFGSAAAPGQPIDNLFDSVDDFRTVTEDLRVVSRGDGRVEWILGASTLNRRALQGFDASLINAPDRSLVTLFPAWNGKRDEWWGLYGQLSASLTSKLELTLAGRYDDQRYENTSYTDRLKSSVVPVLDRSGQPIGTQVENGNAFQPKGQLSYQFTGGTMGYLTVSRGYRAGYFNTGAFTVPEHTTNYEVGLKTAFLDHRIVANAAVFHIDYSNQQFSTIVATPPYRVSITIPETSIDGIELEANFAPVRYLTLGLGLGYLDASVADGTRSPAAPRFTGSGTVDVSYPFGSSGVSGRLHVDDRYSSSLYLSPGNTQQVPKKNYTNLRIGVEWDRYSLTAYGKNLANTRQAQVGGAFLSGGYERYQNDPRSYGVELQASF